MTQVADDQEKRYFRAILACVNSRSCEWSWD